MHSSAFFLNILIQTPKTEVRTLNQLSRSGLKVPGGGGGGCVNQI